MVKHVTLVLLFAMEVCILLGTGCKTAGLDHKNALTQIMSQLSDPSYSITKLQYVNGFEKDQNNYIVFTTYTRVFNVSSITFAKSMSDSDNPLVRWAQSVAVSSVYGHFEPGDSFDESAKFRFLRTENGWVLQGFEGDEVTEARHTEGTDALAARVAREKQELDTQRQKEIEAASAKIADAQKPDVPEAYDITLRCEDTTSINMVSVDTVKGTAKVGKAFYKDGDTRVAPEDDVFPSGCMVRDVVRVTDSTILIGTEAAVGTCDAVKDSGTGRFAAIDRLSGVMVVSLSIDDAKAGVGMVGTQKSLCRK